MISPLKWQLVLARELAPAIIKESLHGPDRPHEIAGVDKFRRVFFRVAAGAKHAARRV